MAKVAFFNIPAHGHINPTMPVVKLLVQRGEQVVYYAHPDFRAKIERAGAEFRSLKPPSDYDHTRPSRTMVHMAATLVRFTWDWLPDALREIEREGFDYLIHDSTCPWGRCAAEITGTPSICSITSFAVHPAMVRSSIQPSAILRAAALGGVAFVRYQARKRSLRRKYGLTRLGIVDLFSNFTERNIVFTSREFQPRAELFDDRFRFVGPAVPGEQAVGDFPIERLEGQTVIYISLGTLHNDRPEFYRACLQAFAGRDELVVMSIGNKLAVESLGAIPENYIVRSFVPQIEVLKRASVFLTHGGMNSCSEAFYHAVPLVVFPQSLEQTMQARRVSELGAGRTLRGRDARAEGIRRLTLEVLEDARVRAVAEMLQASFRSAGGPPRAAQEILDYRSRTVAAGPMQSNSVA